MNDNRSHGRRTFLHASWKPLAVFLAPVALLLAWKPIVATLRSSDPVFRNIPRTRVARTDVSGQVLAAGTVESTQSTEIRCTLERLTGLGGQSLEEGASTILSLVDDGQRVQAGDIICVMDSSAYEELVRSQEIVVQEARASQRQAELALDVAKIALRAYREGEMLQIETAYKGQIALSRADLARQDDRVAWARRMVDKGYVSLAQLSSERQLRQKLDVDLHRSEMELDNYARFTVPKDLLMLESDITGAKATLDFQNTRLKREEERLALYTSMVDRCTVRAPHGGYVVYANRPGREPRVYEGAPVRERMRLFTLPDQSKLEIEVLLHETVVDRVRAGMQASVRVEALPDRVWSGVVTSVAPVPGSDEQSRYASGVSYFRGHIKLDDPPDNIRPGMTAQARILTGLREDVLTVSTVAVVNESGQDVCYVAHDDSVERRRVDVIHASRDMLEVLGGLNEGEEVFLSPRSVSGSARASL